MFLARFSGNGAAMAKSRDAEGEFASDAEHAASPVGRVQGTTRAAYPR